jgi:hypothetical protein
MSTKRGRPPLPPEQRKTVPVTVWMTADVFQVVCRISGRLDKDLSEIGRAYFERLAERDRELIAQNKSVELELTTR